MNLHTEDYEQFGEKTNERKDFEEDEFELTVSHCHVSL